MAELLTNVLYYGDNLEILRDRIPTESVDLVYLDPPFNSNRDYNIIFKDESGRRSDAQLLAFEDTWHWGPGTEQTYAYLTNSSRHQGRVPSAVSQIVGALRAGIGTNQMLAYLVEMTVRLVELHRVLKATGSLYLHCDPTASHYLKVVLDAIFGPRNFINEIVWKRTSSHNDSVRFGRVHDVLLLYGKTDKPKFNVLRTELDASYVEKVYRKVDEHGRRYRLDNISAPGGRGPVYEWGGITQAWRYTKENMERLHKEGRIKMYPDGRAMINAYVRYLDENEGQPIQDWWDDIGVIAAPAKERLGYPTQKPSALLERILAASSDPGDVVLDPFCGCGTALVAAEKLGRRWIGIDITYLSIAVMRARLRDAFPSLGDVRVIGTPTEVEGARMLARQSLDGRYEFEHWAVSLVQAQPLAGQKKKGADAGIDGRITFTDVGGAVRSVLVSVKSGHVNVSQVRDLIGTMQREDAPLGLFLTLEEPSKPMREEAAKAGLFHSELANRDYPRVQILTIEELLAGKRPQLPLLVLPTYQQAEKVDAPAPGQVELFGT